MTDVRVRFAPSPTGYLHLGSARTGLYNYIFARQKGGVFLLRIEDTDPSRSTDEAIAQIISALREMGLDWDEGPSAPGPHGPYRQTERSGIYHDYIERLLASGHLYPCFCTPAELESERRAAQAEKRAWVYSGRCRDLAADEVARRQAAGEPYTLRFRVPPGKTVFADMLRDPVEFDNATIGDFIVQRSDGSVTYNLAVVVDDVTMEITHVIRGDDHISNTPKQIVIYEALGAPVPHFLHMPLLFGTDRKKLSKRHGATQLEELIAQGYIVDVVRNYLCFLGSEFDESMVSWSLADIVREFDVEKLGTSASIFDPEKLTWMNGRFIRNLSDERLGDLLVGYLTRVGFYRDPAGWRLAGGEAAGTRPLALVPTLVPAPEQDALTRAVAPLVREKIDLLSDFVAIAGWLFHPLVLAEDARQKLADIPAAAQTLAAAAADLRALPAWDVSSVEAVVRALPDKLGVKAKAVFAALRLGLSGQSDTPGLFESLWVLGRDEAAGRLAAAAALLATTSAS
jgi:glutamyl-tRNA synthetase